MRMAKVGVLLDRKTAEKRWAYGLNVFEEYICEILDHTGIPYRKIEHAAEVNNSNLDVLIVGLSCENETDSTIMWQFAERGGLVISYAGINWLARKLGCRETKWDEIGYARLLQDRESDGEVPLRFLRARPWAVTDHDKHTIQQLGALLRRSPDGILAEPVLLQFDVGKGSIDRWAVDIPSTVVAFQQGGGPVFEDGVPAPDGTSDVNDQILKADDRFEMDWTFDRLYTVTGAPYFAFPYADLWREALITHLLQRVVKMGKTLPFVGYWPANVSGVALISLDSDLNNDESALTTLNVLKELNIRSTWCMIEPGYEDHVYERIKQEGHELAFHYNALEADQRYWNEEEFKRQLIWLQTAVGLENMISNKNHYTRFEGWGELFQWCEKNGIKADQSRGPSKRGNLGCLFGTCQPYYPIAWADERNRMYDVLEIGFLTPDVGHDSLADNSIIEPFLALISSVEGIAHFLFHPIHIHNLPKVNQSFRKLVLDAQVRGYEFWTCQEINDWVRKRRGIEIMDVDRAGEVQVQGTLPNQPFVIWVPVVGDNRENDAEETELRFGVRCIRHVVGE